MWEIYKLYQQGIQQFNQQFVEPYLENPMAQWWMDQSMDIALKLYYWPFFAATWEDRAKEYFQTYSICKP